MDSTDSNAVTILQLLEFAKGGFGLSNAPTDADLTSTIGNFLESAKPALKAESEWINTLAVPPKLKTPDERNKFNQSLEKLKNTRYKTLCDSLKNIETANNMILDEFATKNISTSNSSSSDGNTKASVVDSSKSQLGIARRGSMPALM